MASSRVPRCTLADWAPGRVATRCGQPRAGTAAIGPVVAGRWAQTPSACIPRPRLPSTTPNNFRRRIWRPAVRAAEFDGLRIHDLRHTAVALWIAAGASPKEVARRAGHTSVKTVLDVYGHLYDEADVALRERLEAMFVPVVAALPHGFMRPHRPKEACGLLSRDRC
jgi:hypothetical protein